MSFSMSSFILYISASLPSPDVCVLSLFNQCTRSTKDVLERMVNSPDFHGLCPTGTPKTTPLVQEVPASASAEPSSLSATACSRQLDRQAAARLCLLLGKRGQRDSLHSINPAFRLASPSPSLSRSTLIVGDAPNLGFIPPHRGES